VALHTWKEDGDYLVIGMDANDKLLDGKIRKAMEVDDP
jgi:hypothetical protein